MPRVLPEKIVGKGSITLTQGVVATVLMTVIGAAGNRVWNLSDSSSSAEARITDQGKRMDGLELRLQHDEDKPCR